MNKLEISIYRQTDGLFSVYIEPANINRCIAADLFDYNQAKRIVSAVKNTLNLVNVEYKK